MYSFTVTAPLTFWNLSFAADFHGLKTATCFPYGISYLFVWAQTAVNGDPSGGKAAHLFVL